MNSKDKEILEIYLGNETELIKELKKTYQRALDDINSKITDLLARSDDENLASIIYQVDYQNAIKTQIEGILNDLHANNFTTISDYLANCYEDGFISTLYSLQNQGVPLIFPINQEQVVLSLTVNSKLSDTLYNSLGINIKDLKKTIRSEISRGISQSYSFEKIAQLISNTSKNSFNNSVRIARTEGHRITQESAQNCMTNAKKKGAKIVKEWCAVLDSKTRTTHQLLDGKRVDVDKPFVNDNGNKAMYPSGFGIAEEDINCRCCVLQRAEWFLTDEEFTKMNGNTNELQRFKNLDDYNKFKAEFWEWSDNK